MNILEDIQDNIEKDVYLIKRCKDKGCQLKIGRDVENYIIYDIEKYIKNNYADEKTTDCLIMFIINSTKKIAIVELKGKDPGITEIKYKFKSVIKILNKIIKKQALKDYTFYPILLSKKISSEKTKQLHKIKIRFKSKDYSIIKERCNTSLSFIYRKYVI